MTEIARYCKILHKHKQSQTYVTFNFLAHIGKAYRIWVVGLKSVLSVFVIYEFGILVILGIRRQNQIQDSVLQVVVIETIKVAVTRHRAVILRPQTTRPRRPAVITRRQTTKSPPAAPSPAQGEVTRNPIGVTIGPVRTDPGAEIPRNPEPSDVTMPDPAPVASDPAIGYPDRQIEE